MLFRLFAIATALFAVALPAHAKGYLSITAKKIHEETAAYDYSIGYPQTGNKAIDADVASWTRGQAADFIDWARKYARGATLDVDFTVKRNDEAGFAVLFSIDQSNAAGGHNRPLLESANYQLPDGWRFGLPELLDGSRGLRKLGALMHAGEIDDYDQLAFVLLPAKLQIWSPPQDLAGEPKVEEIPLSALKDVMRANVRAPAPAFDCARAATAVEKAICSDVVLARLDRRVAEDYRHAILLNGEEPVSGSAVQRGQRAWLAGRAKACGGKPNAELVACLSRLYRERVTKLERAGEE